MSNSDTGSSNSIYKYIFENTGIPMFIVEKDKTVCMVNEKFVQELGYLKSEVEGKMKWTELVAPESLDYMIIQHDLRRENSELALSGYEFKYKNKSGNVFDAVLTIGLIPGTDKSIASVTDISELKKTREEAVAKNKELIALNEELAAINEEFEATNEELIYTNAQLEESELHYRTLFENIKDVFYQTDMAGVITEMSPSIEKYSGFKREELIGRSVLDLYYDLSDRKNLVKAILKKGTVIDFELRLKTKDERLLVSSTTSHLIFDADGNLSGFEGILRDITERKQAEENLREAEQKYRTLIENLNEIIYSLDDKAVITFISPNIEMLSGYKADDVLGRSFIDFVHPDDLKDRMGQYRKVLSGIIEPSEYRFVNKEGNSVWVKTCPTHVKKNGVITGIKGVLTDITDLKLAEAEKSRIEQDLFRIQKMEVIGTLAGGIAHNFNNILMGIMGYTSLLLSKKESSHPDFEYLKNIEGSVRYATELTKNLLGFARGGKYEVRPINLNDIIRNEIKVFSQTRKDVAIHGKYTELLSMVDADQGQLRQVFLNLFINAWQAMPGGGNIYVDTANVILRENDISAYDLPTGKYVKISVTDTGIGMDKKTLDHIFTPFFSTKDTDEGTGLGLASVYGIVTNHGGIIKVYSEKGKGSTFDIYLPASKSEIQKIFQEESNFNELIMGEGTILLVDDEKGILSLCEKLLNSLGYKTIKCDCGIKAVETYLQMGSNISMILLDMTMPDMGGGETYDRLKKINPDVLVLLASGYAVDGEAQEILNRGCSGFIQKPFTITELSKKIYETLQRK